MARIILDNNLPALPDHTHPYAVQEIADALFLLMEENKLDKADLRAIADKLAQKADDRKPLNYQDYGNNTRDGYEHFGL